MSKRAVLARGGESTFREAVLKESEVLYIESVHFTQSDVRIASGTPSWDKDGTRSERLTLCDKGDASCPTSDMAVD